MAPADERRHFTRIPIEGQAVIICGGRRLEVPLLDLSLKGALTGLPPGDPGLTGGVDCDLAIQLEGAEQAIDMEVTVAHREADRVGFRCRRIGLESISQLRRLVELNLGDPALLERELEEIAAKD